MNFREASEHMKQLPEVMDAVAREAIELDTEVKEGQQETAQDEAKIVRKNIKEQLLNAEYTTTDANALSRIYEQRVLRQSQLLGKSPLQIFREENVNINLIDSRQDIPTGDQVFEQKDERLSRAEAAGFDTSRVLYHGGVAKITEFKTNKKGANKYLEGVYTTPQIGEAERYRDFVKNRDQESEIYAFYVPKNLLNLDSKESVDKAIKEIGLEEYSPKRYSKFKYNLHLLIYF